MILTYDQKTNTITTKCSSCGGVITLKPGAGLSASFLVRILRLANPRLADTTTHCPGCERK